MQIKNTIVVLIAVIVAMANTTLPFVTAVALRPRDRRIADRGPVAATCQLYRHRRRSPPEDQHCFAFLIATAIVMYFAMWPILLIAALIGFFRGLYWLCDRYPRTMLVLLTIITGLMGRRRRR